MVNTVLTALKPVTTTVALHKQFTIQPGEEVRFAYVLRYLAKAMVNAYVKNTKTQPT
ncbi:hypothetical protein O9929_07930 [Vibrio lentus]|nr:hypothetical protein [Vibrio lentus]